MIKLNVQPYCERCKDFEAEVEKQYTTIFTGIANATQRYRARTKASAKVSCGI